MLKQPTIVASFTYAYKNENDEDCSAAYIVVDFHENEDLQLLHDRQYWWRNYPRAT